MKKLKIAVYIAVFALICAGTVSFLDLFSPPVSPVLGYVDWSFYEIVNGDGVAHPIDLQAAMPQWEWQPGQIIRLTGQLPELEEKPEYYGSSGCLVMDCNQMELTVAIDGKERLKLSAPCRDRDTYYSQVYLSLLPADAGKEIAVQYVPYGEEAIQSPYLARFSGEDAVYRFAYSTAADNALPAGFFTLEFMFICGLFLIGLAEKSPDWTLLLLALSAFLATAVRMDRLSGFYFLPQRIHDLLNSNGMSLALLVICGLYLWLNRKRSLWLYLLRATACVGVVLVVWYGIDIWRHGAYARTVETVLQSLLMGRPENFFYYLCSYLTTMCVGISVYWFFRTQLRMRMEANMLAQRSRLARENYHQMEQSLQRTSLMRHEWKNQVALLHLLAVQGEYEKLRQTLEQMDSELTQMGMVCYCDNFTVNVILQNTAARASKMGIQFTVEASLPEKLAIEEGDLVSLLINMLDNALEAAVQVDGDRRVEIHMSVSQKFLVIACKNTYAGTVFAESRGNIRSTKPNPEQHGIGMTQMRHIAEKYGGVLDTEHSDCLFTVRTALSMKSAPQ